MPPGAPHGAPLRPASSQLHMPRSRRGTFGDECHSNPPHDNAWKKLQLDKSAAEFGVKRGDQPARSPDLNVLDLYVWRVLESGVHRRRPKTLVELWAAIKAAWDEDLTAAKLECAYRLLTPVMGLINDKNGGNNFTLPHTGIRKHMREDGWEI